MIVGVYASATENVIVQETRKIGLEQCIASVEAKGFVNYKNATIEKAEPTLPKNFAKDTWSMVYEAKDQNGMPLDAKLYDSREITFISNNPLLLQSDFEQDRLYTLKDENGVAKQYASVKIKPGDYADQGGEVTITAISSKAGQRKDFNIIIGEAPRLKTLELLQPNLVTDGEEVTLNYVAKDVNGNDVTSYETIVRSSNTLSLSASTGTLTVSEGNDGKAVIKWRDSEEKIDYTDARSYDNIERMVSLTTIVVGGESKNIMLHVKDKRRPVAFKSVDFGLDKNDAMVVGNTSTTNLLSDQVVYVDQYGSDMKGSVAANFFNVAFDKFNDERYCLRVKTDDGKYLGLAKDAIYGAKASIAETEKGTDAEGKETEKVTMVDAPAPTVKFEARDNQVKVKEDGAEKDVAELEYYQKAGTTTVTYSIATVGTSGIVDKGNTFVATYNTVPQGMVVSNVEATPNKAKYQMLTSNSNNANGSYLENECFVATPGSTGVLPVESADDKNPNTLKLTNGSGENVSYTVKGKARRLNNISLTLPAECYSINEEKSEILYEGDNVYAVSQGAISWGELYNDNDAKRLRKDARKILALEIFNNTYDFDKEKGYDYSRNHKGNPVNNVETTFAISDALSYPVDFNKTFSYKVNPTATVLIPTKDPADIWVVDQYGYRIDGVIENYNITLTEEAQTDDTHLNGSLEVVKNNTNDALIRGAEIGDKCKIVTNVVLPDGRTVAFNKTHDITIGSDTLAYISDDDVDHDKNWRKADTYGKLDGKTMVDDVNGKDGLGLGMNR